MRLRLKEYRAKAGMTQMELAVATGMSLNSVATMERRADNGGTRLMTAYVIAQALGVDLAELIDAGDDGKTKE